MSLHFSDYIFRIVVFQLFKHMNTMAKKLLEQYVVIILSLKTAQEFCVKRWSVSQ